MATTLDLEYQKCLKQKKIRPFSRGKSLSKKELASAQGDLKVARLSFKNKNFKWATVQCYYSMFHSARALLYNKNLSEKSHYCLILALKVLYGNEIGLELIESFSRAKNLREDADYYDRWSPGATRVVLKDAGKFLSKAKKIIL